MENLKSDIFDHLSWDQEDPEFPVLNGTFALEEVEIDIAMIGSERMQSSWPHFLSNAETECLAVLAFLPVILAAAETAIHSLHQENFGDQWEGSANDLLHELELHLICFYSDGDAHLWFQGGAAFDYMDVEIGLDSELRPFEVRFDD